MGNFIYEQELGFITALELKTILGRAFDNARQNYENAITNGALSLATIYKSEMDSIIKFQLEALEKQIKRNEEIKNAQTNASTTNDPLPF